MDSSREGGRAKERAKRVNVKKSSGDAATVGMRPRQHLPWSLSNSWVPRVYPYPGPTSPPTPCGQPLYTKAAGGREGAKIARGRQHGRRADRRAWLNAPPPPTARRARQFRIYLATSTEPTYLMCPSSVWSFTMLLWRSPVDIVQMKVSRTSRFLLGRHLPRADVWG